MLPSDQIDGDMASRRTNAHIDVQPDLILLTKSCDLVDGIERAQDRCSRCDPNEEDLQLQLLTVQYFFLHVLNRQSTTRGEQ